MAVAPLSANVIYIQPYDGQGNAYASQNDTTGGLGLFATVYDNFTLAGGGTITDVAWTGSYFSGTRSAIAQWTVNLYADNAGAPGTSLYVEAFTGTGNETLLSGGADTNAPLVK